MANILEILKGLTRKSSSSRLWNNRLWNNRLRSNRLIVARLAKLVEKYPDWRFHQLLQNVGVSRPGEDQFYEESKKTLENMKM